MPRGKRSDKTRRSVVVEGMGSFTIEEGRLLEFVGDGIHVEIPEGVTSIGEQAFVGCDKLESLVLPESVTEIRERAFSYCNRMRQVNLPAGLTFIGPSAFQACHSLEGVTIPEGVTEICQSTFRYSGIPWIKLPEGLRTIGKNAFAHCRNLKQVSLPGSLRQIGDRAFGCCEELETVTGLEQVETVAVDAFDACRKLADENGLVISGTTLVNAFLEGVRQLVIPAHITTIRESVLYDTGELEAIVIPDTVTQICDDFLWNPFTDTGIEKLRTLILPTHMKTLKGKIRLPSDLLEQLQAPGVSIGELKEQMLLDPATVGYLCAPEVYTEPETVAAYQRLAVRRRSQIIPLLLRGDRVRGFATYGALGKITPANFTQDFFRPALEAGATQCIAFLMDWKEKHISPEAEEKRLLRELNKDVYCATDMKKLWACKKQADGTWVITGYKGTETELVIPPRIGKIPVTAIGEEAFFVGKSGRPEHRRAVLRALQTVTIPEGVTAIGGNAFGQQGLTLRGKAGSFAETYAKEQGIPFIKE